MKDDQGKVKKTGKVIGFLVMYIIFTTILYFILKLLGKLPENWNYMYVVLITIFIVLLGILIKLLLR
tara:strand:- start:509 stop:709 length:201 start_codon:yes stop_codon:yes gene_type:complete